MTFIRGLWRAVRSRILLRRLKGTARMAARWELSSMRICARMERDVKLLPKLQRRQEATQRKLESLQREIEEASERFSSDLDERIRRQKEHEVLVDSQRSELRGYEESLVPFFTHMDELKLQRIKADIAVLAAKEALLPRQADVGG